MSNKITYGACLLFISVVITLQGCRSDIEKNPSWDVELLAPVLSATLAIDDLVADSLITTDEDDLLHIVYQNKLFSYNILQEGIEIPDTTLQTTVSLDSLKLEDQSLEQSISIGRILIEAGFGPLMPLITSGFPFEIPALSGLSSDPIPIDATSFFQEADIDSGFLDIEVFNGTPIDVENVQFRLTDPVGGITLIEDTFALIPKGGSVSASADLSGLTLGGLLEAELLSISSPGSGSAIVIDTSDALIVTASVHDLKVSHAVAIFPAQNLVDDANDVVYDMGGPEITNMKIRSGLVRIFVVSTIGDTVIVEYAIPDAVSLSGESVAITAKVPPAPPGASITVEEIFDLSSYTIDLRGSTGLETNTFFNTFSARIDSTGNLVDISLEDSIMIIYGLEDIVPEQIRGYAGQDQLDVSQSSPFDLASGLSAESLDLEQVSLGMSIVNGYGIEANVRIDEFTASHSQSGNAASLTAASIIGQNISLNRALDNPFVPGITELELNAQNSNIDALIEVLPDQLDLNAVIDLNPLGNNFGYQDFLNYESALDVNLDMDIPLSLIASELQLTDTIDFDLGTQIDNGSEVTDGVLTLNLTNGFPLQAFVQIIFLDAGGQELMTLFSTPFDMQAAILGPDCRVSQSTGSAVDIELDEARTDLLEQATSAIIDVNFSTSGQEPCDGFIKIYSSYELFVSMTANLNFTIVAEF